MPYGCSVIKRVKFWVAGHYSTKTGGSFALFCCFQVLSWPLRVSDYITAYDGTNDDSVLHSLPLLQVLGCLCLSTLRLPVYPLVPCQTMALLLHLVHELTTSRLHAFQCRSGSKTDTSVRQFIGLNGQPHGTGGGLAVGFPGQPSAIAVNNQGRPDLSVGEEGVYTCRMLGENGDTVEANFGIYRNGFNSEWLHKYLVEAFQCSLLSAPTSISMLHAISLSC